MKIDLWVIIVISAFIGGLCGYGDSVIMNNACYHGSIDLCIRLRNLYSNDHVGTLAVIGDLVAISIYLLDKKGLIT